MPYSLKCLGCEYKKKSKDDKFFCVNNLNLSIINNLRTVHNTRKRKLEAIETIPADSKICKPCYQCVQRNPSTQTYSPLPDLSIYRKGISSHNRCTFGCKDPTKLVAVPSKKRELLLMNFKFFVESNARMCSEHFNDVDYWPLVKQIRKEVSPNEQKLVSDLMFEYYQNRNKNVGSTFDINTLDAMEDSPFKSFFGFEKNEFNKICEFTKNCEAKDVAILLCKMRTALSNEQLAYLFGYQSISSISNHLEKARNDLILNLVPQYVNVHDRETLISNITPLAKELFDIPEDNGCIVFDATYRIAQKSKNFAGQKQLWSEQKKLPLVKPMVGCTPNGYILCVLGPFNAKHNDAQILEDCFQRYHELLSMLHENDVALVDNGFRDVMDFLINDKKLRVYIPGTGERNTYEANLARFVTKVRWIIEQVFGRLKKKFKLLAVPAHNATLSYDFDYLLIASALLNLFHKPILSDDEYDNVGEIMKSRLNVPNKLKIVVNDLNLSQQRVPFDDTAFTALDNEENNSLMQFPQLSLDDLYAVCLGPYQLKNAMSYYAEHVEEDIFLVQKFNPNARHRTAGLDFSKYSINVIDPLLVKAHMKSRYRSGKSHYIFVLVDRAKRTRSAIIEYFCTCESGSRTVGCCSHIATIIWYLGYGQYNIIRVPNPDISNVSITIEKEK